VQKTEALTSARGRSRSIFIIAASLLALTACQKAAQPPIESKISFTQVPQSDAGDQNEEDVIEGTVTGSHPDQT
jgi:hypothetical protein